MDITKQNQVAVVCLQAQPEVLRGQMIFFSNHIFYNFNILPPCPALSTFNCVRFYFAMFIIFICTCTPSFLNRTYFEKQLQKTRFIYWEEGFVQSSVKAKMWDSGSTSIFNSFITEPSN